MAFTSGVSVFADSSETDGSAEYKIKGHKYIVPEDFKKYVTVGYTFEKWVDAAKKTITFKDGAICKGTVSLNASK